MSFAVDVNILLYASDSGSALHERASGFLRGCVSGDEVFCLGWVTVMSYLRMSTHPAIFARPLSHEDAASNVEALLSTPRCRILSEEEGFWEVYRQVTADVPTRGNLVPDAHLAALLR